MLSIIALQIDKGMTADTLSRLSVTHATLDSTAVYV